MYCYSSSYSSKNDKPSCGGKRFSSSPIKRVYEELKRRFIISVVAERPRLHKNRMALSTNRKTKGRNEREVKREVSKRIQDSRGGDSLSEKRNKNL
jgi:hypothetical protein